VGAIVPQTAPEWESSMKFRSILSALRPARPPHRGRSAARRAAVRPRLEPLDDRCLPSAAFIPEWNDLVLDVQRLPGRGTAQAPRALAILNPATSPWAPPTPRPPGVSRAPATPAVGASDDAAAAQAAHDVARGLYPNDVARFDGLLNNELDELVREGET